MVKKRTLLFFIVAVLSVNAIYAQRTGFQVWAGANFAQIDGDGSGNYNHLGLHVAVNASFAIGQDDSSPFGVLVEVGFTQKGSYVNHIDRSINLSYVEVPVLLYYKLMDGRLRLGAGVAPALLVNASVVDHGVLNEQQSDNFRRLDALPVCLDLNYLIGEHWGILARFQTSMMPISVESASGVYRIFRSNKGTFSRLLSAGLSYSF